MGFKTCNQNIKIFKPIMDSKLIIKILEMNFKS